MPERVSVTLHNDAGCPWGYSANPAFRVLEWRYGAQLEWRLVLIGLTNVAQEYVDRGYTPLRSAEGYARRFGLHPLQSFSKARGQEQLDGAAAAITAETDEGSEVGFELARLLGLDPFELAEEDRALYHAGAAIASNYLVTLHGTAAEIFDAVGAPTAGLRPLMQGVIDNGFELTGPIARGDWDTVDRHLDALRERKPKLEPLYRVLAEATAP